MGDEHAAGTQAQVSAIVVTHNNEAFIADCLGSIQRAAAVSTCELVVVDNGSSDRTTAVVRDHPGKPRLVELAENVGFAAATNVGIRASSGRLIALVNSDAFPDPGSIDTLIAAIDELPRAGIVGAQLRYPDGQLQPSTGNFPSLLGGLWVAVFLHRAPLTARLGIGIAAHPALYRERRQVDWVTAAFCIARRDAGPLPERGFMYGEDVEWALACKSAGFETWLEPAATAIHLGRGSVDVRQGRGFVQWQRARFELAWFGAAGRANELAARAVLATHALLRIALFGPTALLGRRRSRPVREYFALLRAAFSKQ
jgi:N-acetylglucosaminyl-diphospho-decaprenol L-rhamnosyltransferase